VLEDYQALIEKIIAQQKVAADQGQIASYIPELRKISANKCGIHLVTSQQQHYSAGDSNEKFSIQSVAKVLSLVLAFKAQGNTLWSPVGVEPSGTAFNSLVQLEYELGVPRNPFINAGAIVICDVLVSCYPDPKQEILNFIRGLCGVQNIAFNAQVVH
jgi:glutaminase